MPQRHRHEYAADLPRGLGAVDIHGNQVARLRSVRRNPAHIRQIEAGGLALEGRSETGSCRTPSCLACRAPDRLAVPTGLGVVGAACHPARPSRLARLPPALPGCCDSPAAESFHLRTVHGASWRSMSQLQTWFGASASSSGLTLAGWVAWRRRSRTSPSARSRRSMVGTEQRYRPSSRRFA